MKQRNPDVDFGFHATIPRMVRTEYKKLTPTQKWLYVCLKDLCGEDGTCYRTLRVLSEETGISTGMLSESITELHTAGLIHAEKKKRSSGGKEVWHITIVDIWKANGERHPTKRSPREQERSQNEQTSENVHTANDNVHYVNEPPTECSPGEQECSLCETEEGSGEEESSVGSGEPAAPASLPATDSHSHAGYTKLPARATPIPFAEQAKAISEKRQTDPALPVVKPSQQKPTSQSQAPGQPDGAPPASVGATARPSAGQDMPAMALTAKQIKQQNERRAKDIWAIIERERQTKYSRTQRELYENSRGIECIIADDIRDETLIKALGAMDPYQRRNFTVSKFYGWIPNLTANESPPSQNGKQEPPVTIRPAHKVRSFNGIAANS